MPFPSPASRRTIAGVVAISRAIGDPDAGHLRGLAAAVRRRRGVAGIVAAIVRVGVPGGILTVLAAWFWPQLVPPLALVGSVLLLLAAAIGYWRSSHDRAEVLLRGLPPAVASGAALADGFATWLEVDGSSRSPMLQWLAADLTSELARLPAAALRQLGRSSLGALRWLVPVLVVLLLAYLFLHLLAPDLPGVLGGGAGGGGGGGRGSTAGGNTAVAPQAQPQGTPPPPMPAPPPAPPPPQAPTEPPPLLDLPVQESFVVPHFVGDGAARRAWAMRAQIEEGPASAPRPQPSGSSGGPGAAAPAPSAAEFQRAYENALQSRHVPPSEQAMVRNFFELLRRGGR
jgi:hypothetical protein